MSDAFALIHISDPHFHRVPRRAAQWFSKRGLGAANLLLRRARLHPLERALRLVRKLDEQDWQHLVISGDLTQLALEEEFALAREVLAPLLARGPERVTVLPGNHDRYVAEPQGQDYFRDYFGEFFSSEEIATRRLTGLWHLAAWDSTLPTGPFLASGRVRPQTLAATEEWMKGLPAGARIVLANHYPLHLAQPHRFKPNHDLTNLEDVRAWVAARPIALYLHGHVHENWVLSVGAETGEQIHVNSASSTRIPRAHHTSAYHRIELGEGPPRVQPLALD